MLVWAVCSHIEHHVIEPILYPPPTPPPCSSQLVPLQKVTERKATLAKMTFTDERQRERWLLPMNIEFMSSEESGQDGDEEVMVVNTLPWRSHQVNRLFKQLDDKTNVNRTPKARRQVIPRTFSGEPSSRPRPADDTFPAWLFKD